MKPQRLRSATKALVFRAMANGAFLALKRARLRSTQSLLILNLHSIGPPNEQAFSPLSREYFEALLRYLTRFFEIVTFSDLADLPKAKRPRVILSFDDGYRDFIETAVPLLRRYNVRVNHNVIPSCIESGLPPLNVLLASYVEQLPERAMQLFNSTDVRLGENLSALQLSEAISNHIRALPVSDQDRLKQSILPRIMDDGDCSITPMMSRDEVRQLSLEHEIGAHSFDHASMAMESDEYLRDDVNRCTEYFASALSTKLTIYAFPNGSYRPKQTAVVQSQGVDHVLLVGEGLSRADAHVHHRVTFDARSRPEVFFRGTGSYCWPMRHGDHDLDGV